MTDDERSELFERLDAFERRFERWEEAQTRLASNVAELSQHITGNGSPEKGLIYQMLGTKQRVDGIARLGAAVMSIGVIVIAAIIVRVLTLMPAHP